MHRAPFIDLIQSGRRLAEDEGRQDTPLCGAGRRLPPRTGRFALSLLVFNENRSARRRRHRGVEPYESSPLPPASLLARQAQQTPSATPPQCDWDFIGNRTVGERHRPGNVQRGKFLAVEIEICSVRRQRVVKLTPRVRVIENADNGERVDATPHPMMQ